LKRGQGPRIDEFAFILLAGVIFIIILMVFWTTPTEPVPLVEPTSITRSIARGTSSFVQLNISGDLTNVSLSASGDVRPWISFTKNNFNVIGYDVVGVKISVPSAAPIGIFTGSIRISSLGGEVSIPLSIEVIELNVTALPIRRTIVLGDVTVSYLVGEEVIDSKEDFEVVGGYFERFPAYLSGIISTELLPAIKAGTIRLVVRESNEVGNLIVKFNDEEIFNRMAVPGEYLIDIDPRAIKRSNTIAISSGAPLWRFWISSIYKFSLASFEIEYEEKKFKDMEFVLAPEEVLYFKSGKISFRCKKCEPVEDLLIEINGVRVFKGRPPLLYFTQDFGPEIPLNIGSNRLSLSTEAGAYFDISDLAITISRTA
jgi:hypothetical protein